MPTEDGLMTPEEVVAVEDRAPQLPSPGNSRDAAIEAYKAGEMPTCDTDAMIISAVVGKEVKAVIKDEFTQVSSEPPPPPPPPPAPVDDPED